MGLPLLFGSLLIAIGPSAIFFVTTVSRRPYLLIAALFGYLSPPTLIRRLLHGIASMLIGGIIYSIWSIWGVLLALTIVIR